MYRFRNYLEKDEAEIFDKSVPFDCTSLGPYGLSLDDTEIRVECNFACSKDSCSRKDQTWKLHQQLAHPSARRLKVFCRSLG